MGVQLAGIVTLPDKLCSNALAPFIGLPMKAQNMWYYSLLVAGVSIGFPLRLHAGQKYTIVDLGEYARPRGINELGHVVGWMTWSPAGMYSFIWSQGQMTQINTPLVQTWVNTLNNEDAVVGTDEQTNVFVWKGGITTLIPLPDAASTINVYDLQINDHGHVSGWYEDISSLRWGFIWKDGALVRIPLQNAQTRGINNAEQVAVYQNGGCGLWDNGVYTVFGKIEGSWQCDPDGLNNLGSIIGRAFWTSSPAQARPFILQNGAFTLLGDFGLHNAYATGINDQDRVVLFENYVDSGVGISVGYLWDSGNLMDLASSVIPRTSDWSNLIPAGINNSGQITGVGTFKGQEHGFILNPAPTFARPFVANDGVLNLPASAILGNAYFLEGSTNLVDWVRISTNVAESIQVTFKDPQASSFSKRFYRLVQR